MADPTLVAARGLAVRFPGERRDALRGISLALAAGERVGVLGPSGCGKSTLALALAGAIPALVPATVSGEIAWRGDAPGAARVALVQQDVEAQLVALSVEGEIAFALENRGVPVGEIDRRIALALADGPARGLQPGEETLRLSTGWRQRLALAAALAEQACLAVLDEPTAHLDEAAAAQAVAFLADRAKGALLLIEHRADLVAPRADRLLVLDRDGVPVVLDAPGPALEAIAARPDLGLRLPAAARAALALRRLGTVPEGGLAPDARSLERAIGGDSGRRAAVMAALAPPARAPGPAAPALMALDDATLRRGSSTVLHGVSLALGRGEVVGLAGGNGAGKTSLALLAAGALRPAGGRRVVRKGLAATMVPQDPALVFASASLALEAARRGLPWTAAARALEAFGIAPAPGRHPLLHSRGELRRIALAMALAGEDDGLVVLDEPTAGLDAHGLSALEARLDAGRAQGRGTLLVSHDLDWLACVSDRVHVLDAGRIVASGAPDAICDAAVRGALPLAPPPGAALAAALGWRAAS